MTTELQERVELKAKDNSELGRRWKIPLFGIGILMSLAPLTAILSLFSSSHVVVLGSLLLEGQLATIYHVLHASVGLVMLYGIFKTKEWGAPLLIGWQVYTILISGLKLLTYLINPKQAVTIYNELFAANMEQVYTASKLGAELTTSLVIAIVTGGLIIFFTNKYKEGFIN